MAQAAKYKAFASTVAEVLEQEFSQLQARHIDLAQGLFFKIETGASGL